MHNYKAIKTKLKFHVINAVSISHSFFLATTYQLKITAEITVNFNG